MGKARTEYDFLRGDWVLEEMLKVAMEDEKQTVRNIVGWRGWRKKNGIGRFYFPLPMMRAGI